MAIALVVYFALTNERLQGVLTLALTATPVAAALYHARHLETLFNATTNDALRTAQGHAFGRWALAAIGLAIVAQAAAALVTRAIPLAGRRRHVVGAVMLVVALVVVSGAGWPSPRGTAGRRLVHKVPTSSPRRTPAPIPSRAGPAACSRSAATAVSPWPARGSKSFPHHPLAGTGAGTFRFTNYLYRTASMRGLSSSTPTTSGSTC